MADRGELNCLVAGAFLTPSYGFPDGNFPPTPVQFSRFAIVGWTSFGLFERLRQLAGLWCLHIFPLDFSLRSPPFKAKAKEESTPTS
jgi:hypothetical protein